MTSSELAKSQGYLIYYNHRSIHRRFELVDAKGNTVNWFRTLKHLRDWLGEP